jgi:hypothetical protein
MRATQRKSVIPLVFKRRTRRRHHARRYAGSVHAPWRREFDSNVEVVTEKYGREFELSCDKLSLASAAFPTLFASETVPRFFFARLDALFSADNLELVLVEPLSVQGQSTGGD